MTAYITNQYRIIQAQTLRAAIAAGTDTYYLGIGKQTPWTTEASPDAPSDSFGQLVTDYRDLLSLKRVVAANTTAAVPIRSWVVNTAYTMYDDADTALNTKAFYVTNSNYDVYKCIDNNKGALSTVQPTGTSTGTFQTADGYVWKYMTTITAAKLNTFPSQNWIPIATLAVSDGSNQWATQQAAVNGAIHVIKVTNGGSGYATPPSVTVTGDGTGCTATANLVGGVVDSITVTNIGSGYTYANVAIGSGTATARAIISPFGGHGKDIENELFASYTMLTVVLNLDEGGAFSVANDYRKIVLVKNPLLYGTPTVATATTLDASRKLTFTSVSGTFVADETVTQATSGASGTVIDWNPTTKVLRLNNVLGTFDTTHTVTGGTSGAIGGTPITITNPDIQPNSGILFYKDYRKYINRSIDQRESISVILSF